MRGRAALGRTLGSVRQMTANTTAPTGRLTKKTHCQPTVSVITPPIAGPMSELIPNTAPTRPWYLPRSAASNRSPMTARATGKSAPAPRPCTARKPTSCHISREKPAKIEPTRNTATANSSTGRRPKRSDSLP